jgi:hypothetical protein
MKLNLFLLSAAAMVNAATATEPVNLQTAANYAILAKTGISTVPASDITGNIAVSPIAASAITGFDLVMDVSNTYSTDATLQVRQATGSGKAFASDYTSPTRSALTTAVSDMENAYTDAASRPTTGANLNLGGGSIGGETLSSGVYTFDRDVLVGPGTELTFSGSDSDIFIIQTTGSIVLAANTNMVLVGGAKAENIFWQVAGKVTVGAGAHMEGVLLVKTGVTFITGSSLNGRILAQTAVTLQMATITQKPDVTL